MLCNSDHPITLTLTLTLTLGSRAIEAGARYAARRAEMGKKKIQKKIEAEKGPKIDR